MAKHTDSDEQARGDGLLHFSTLLDCPGCGETFEGHWTDPSLTIEDMTDPPVAEQECAACGHKFTEEYPGWMFRSEA